MQFKDIVGQEDLIQKMIHLVRQGHLPHAILLQGLEGSGGLPLAIATTQYIMCTERSEVDSCGECAACTKVSKLQHPDIHFSFPTFKYDSSKIPVSNYFMPDFRNFVLNTPYGNDTDWLKFIDADKQGNITAAECREIILKLQLRSFESEYKVMIMWYPEYLGNEGNILLKLIEEPTPKTILFFVAVNAEQVLATIQSRTQLFPLKRISELDIQQALVKRGIESSKSLQLARMAEGNFQTALQLLHETENDLIGLLRNWLNAIYANKGLELVQWSHEMAEYSKDEQKKFLMYVLQLLEHLIRYKETGNQHVSLLESEQKIIDILISKGLNAFMLEKIHGFLNNTLYQIERNANSKILFHSLSLRLQEVVVPKLVV